MSDQDITNLNRYRETHQQKLLEQAHQRGEAFELAVVPVEYLLDQMGYSAAPDGQLVCTVQMNFETLRGLALTPKGIRLYAEELLRMADQAECAACRVAGTSQVEPCPAHRETL